MTLANKIVYIAGPLNGDVATNVERAENVADMLARMQIGFFCPHFRGAEHMDLGVDESYWVEYGLEMLRRSDALLLIPDWHNSKGTKGEIAEAKRCSIPVFELDEIENLVLELLKQPKVIQVKSKWV